MPNKKVDILVVDDRQDGLMAVLAVLDYPEYNLVTANSGEQALLRVLEHNFALILLDVQMPGMDGFETAAMIKRREKSRDIPIIFVTAISKETTFVYKGYQTGAVDYIFKPFDAQILKSKVAVYVDLFGKNQKILQQSELIREGDRRARIQQLAALEIESLSRYRNLADSIPHIVWKCQPDGTLDYCNKVWTSYTGLSLDQSVGIGWQHAFDPDDLKNLFILWKEALRDGHPFEAECRIRSQEDGPNEKLRWHLFRAVPEKLPPIDTASSDPLLALEQIGAWVATATDIDERKTIEKNLVLARDEANKASIAKTNFLANMSHEIRTPLGIVLGYSELMADPDATQEERTQHLTTVKHNGELLSDLIGDILDLSKIESGHLELESKVFALPQLIAGVLKSFQFKAKKKNIQLLLEFKSKIPDFIKTDPTRLRQILFNVIGNALKFTSAGDVKLQISFDDLSRLLTVDVVDSGIGITKEQEEKIFKPFMQADTSTTRQFGGTGLGLSLSRKLARALHGDINLAWSEFGKGSLFRITVSIGLLNEYKLIDIVEDPTQFESSQKFTQKKDQLPKLIPRLDAFRILLVEDSPDNQILIGRFLKSAGAKVETANNGKDALEKMENSVALKTPFDLILMDIQMPIMDGYQATKELRLRKYSIPIIALTAHAFEEERDRCLKDGCDEHLTKPVNRELLITAIAKCIENKQVQRRKAAAQLREDLSETWN